ncbi:MAG: MATE family efflux transporter [Oscillospiraceae bacterium]
MKDNTRQREQLIKMTQTPVKSLILRLALPSIISMLISTLYNMADTYFVSQINTSASGAVGVVFTISAVIQAVGFCFGIGSGTMISKELGRGDSKEAGRLASTSFFLSIFLGLIITAVGALTIKDLVFTLGATETIAPYAVDYAIYILLAAAPMIGSYVLSCQLRIQGYSMRSMIGLGIGGILNIGLDPLFIFTFDMGIAGAAIATGLSQVISFIILLYMANKYGLTPIRFRNFSFRLKRIWNFTSTGSPSFFRQIISAVSTTILNNIAGPYGDGAIAAMSIAGRVQFFLLATLMGFYQGFQSACGFNMGAKRYDRVSEALWFCAKAAIVYMVCLSAIVIPVAPSIIRLFRSDALVVEIGSRALRFQAIVTPIMSWNILMNFYFQVEGNNLASNYLVFSRQGFVYIPLLLILPSILGLTGLEMTLAATELVSFIIALPLSINAVKQLRERKAQTLAELASKQRAEQVGDSAGVVQGENGSSADSVVVGYYGD